MDVLVCVKRVPETGARITLTADEREIDTAYLGFTISPHEECAVEEALRLVEAHGGSTTVLTLGPAAAAEQLRNALAMGIGAGILLETDGDEFDPAATAAAIVDAVRDRGFDLLLFGNEAADSGDYQVAVRVAAALGLPCVTGIKGIEIEGGQGGRTARGGRRLGGLRGAAPGRDLGQGGDQPAALPVAAGAAAREEGRARDAHRRSGARPGLEKVRLVVPVEEPSAVEILGNGPEAAPRVVEVLKELGVVS